MQAPDVSIAALGGRRLCEGALKGGQGRAKVASPRGRVSATRSAKVNAGVAISVGAHIGAGARTALPSSLSTGRADGNGDVFVFLGLEGPKKGERGWCVVEGAFFCVAATLGRPCPPLHPPWEGTSAREARGAGKHSRSGPSGLVLFGEGR